MDPLTGMGIASAATSIIAKIIPTIFSVKEAWEGIKQVDETNTGFIEELTAFEFALNVIDNGLRKGGPAVEQEEWWSTGRMTDLLHNAVKTMSRLDFIFKDMSRERRVLASMRSYYRGHMYEKEIGHLTNRLRTYTSCLKLPTMISVISAQFNLSTGPTNAQSSSTPSLSDGSDTIFEDEIQETNVAIRRVLQDIPEVCVSLDQRQDDTPKNSVEDCQDLTEIAAKIVHTLSSVASNEPIAPLRTAHLPTRPTFRDWESASVSGVPLGFQTSRVLREWSDGIEALAPQSTTDQWWGANKGPTFGESQVDMNTQRITKASSLFREGKFKQAVPWLEKSLQTLPEQHPRRTNVQLMLAKCLMEIEPLSPKAETLLSDVVNNSTHDQNAEALGLLAVVRKELYPNDLKKAKESCELAISARRNVFGQRHEKTIESISLMIHLCELSDDIDATIWQEHLPDDRASPGSIGAPPLRLLRAFSPFARPNSVSQPDMQKQLDKIKTLEQEVQRYQGIVTKQKQALKEEQETAGSALTMHNRSHDEYVMISAKLTEMEQNYRSLQSEHLQLKAKQAEELSTRPSSREGSNDLRGELEKERQRANGLNEELSEAREDCKELWTPYTQWKKKHESAAERWELQRQKSRERMRKDHNDEIGALKNRLESLHKEQLKSTVDKLRASHQDELLFKAKQHEEELATKLEWESRKHASELEALKDAHDNDLESRLGMFEGDHVAKLTELHERLAQSKADLRAVMMQIIAIDPQHPDLMQAKTPERAAQRIGYLYREALNGWREEWDRARHFEERYLKMTEVLMEVGLMDSSSKRLDYPVEIAKALMAAYRKPEDESGAVSDMPQTLQSRLGQLAATLQQRVEADTTSKAADKQNATRDQGRPPEASTHAEPKSISQRRLERRKQPDERQGQTKFHKRTEQWRFPASTPDDVSDPGQGRVATLSSSIDQRKADGPQKTAERVPPSTST